MKNFKKNLIVSVLAIALVLGFTPPIPAHAATSPSLGAAASFSVIGATGITGTVPTSGITGNVGNPAGGQITNLTAVMVGGTIQSFDNIAPGLATMNANVMTNLSTAYDNLNAGDNAVCTKASDGTSGTDTGVIELGGKSLAPGVYCTAGSFQITGNLILTGTTGTWVFKAATGLTTMTGSSVTGGDPCNVWWRIGTAAAGLGTNSTFIGTIIASTGITFGTGVTLNGRALALGANVTLNSGGTISGPTCGATAATLTLVKTISGGTRTLADFPLTATGPTTITGVSGAGSVTGATVTAGTYTLSEVAQSDYAAGTWSCTNGITVNGSSQITLSSGNTTTCTITNTFVPVIRNTSSGSSVMPIFNPTINIIGTPIIPKLPKTGFPPQESGTWYESLLNNILNLFR